MITERTNEMFVSLSEETLRVLMELNNLKQIKRWEKEYGPNWADEIKRQMNELTIPSQKKM